jgi:SAM-dependent methyltransferase
MRNWNRINDYYDELCADVYVQPDEENRIEITRSILSELKLDDIQTILDVGCGMGYAHDLLPGKEYTGITLSEAEERGARELGRSVVVCDFNFITLGRTFDLVLSSHSLEHSPFPLLTLMEWHRVGRKLLLIVPNPAHYGYVGQNHYAVSNPSQLRWLLRRAGWKVTWKKITATDIAYYCEGLARISQEGWASHPLSHEIYSQDKDDTVAEKRENIVVAVRCFNEEKHIEGFLRGYDFADTIVVSDGGSTDNSIELLRKNPKVVLLHYDTRETVNGQTWNPDAGHMNFVLDAAKTFEPDWLIFDDMDCHPNYRLRENAREILKQAKEPQVNVFRLYMWGEREFFPAMNGYFDDKYTSLWAWRPNLVNIHADPSVRHGTLVGIHPTPEVILPPVCLLHRSWNPETIDQKIKRYNKLDLPMTHPFEFAGKLEPLPEWAHD